MQREGIIRLEGDASVKIGRITLTSPKWMILDFIKENTFTISFNQQRQKKMQNIFCDTLDDEKKPRSGLDFRHTAP